MKSSHSLVIALVLFGAGLWLGGLLLNTDAPAQSTNGDNTTPLAAEAPGDVNRPLDHEVRRMQTRIEEQAQRLASLEERLATSEKELVNFQIFVQELTVGAAQQESSNTASQLTERQPPQPSLPLAEYRTGTPVSAILADLGEPDEQQSWEGGGELRYFEKGARVLLDEQGAVRQITVFGEPMGVAIDANGYMGLDAMFREGGRWYHANRWSVNGIAMGTPGSEVVRRLGKSTKVAQDCLGQFHLWYESKALKVVLGARPPFPVIGFRRGGGPPRSNASGHVD